MLDKNRIRLMTKMARYDQKQAEEDLKISSYFKKDYASLNSLVTAIWVTIGYILIVAAYILFNVEKLFEGLTLERLVIMVLVVIGLYIVLVSVYFICANSFYKKRHDKAKRRVKKYYRNLSRLGKMRMKEKR